MLAQARIVLVEPTGPANIGAVCRVMANMGLRDLVLVAPRCDPRDEQAVGFAAHGKPVLDALRCVDDIPAALAGCVQSFATTSRLGLYRRQAAVTPADAARVAIDVLHRGPVAFIFGREQYGLRNHELLHVDRIVTIPADEAYPVLNLGVAVAIVCYELRQESLVAGDEPPLPKALNRDVATDERKQFLFAHLFDALDRVGYFFGPNPDHLKYALRHLFGRTEMSINEVDVLLGMARQIRWYVDHHPQRIDPPPSVATEPNGDG